MRTGSSPVSALTRIMCPIYAIITDCTQEDATGNFPVIHQEQLPIGRQRIMHGELIVPVVIEEDGTIRVFLKDFGGLRSEGFLYEFGGNSLDFDQLSPIQEIALKVEKDDTIMSLYNEKENRTRHLERR